MSEEAKKGRFDIDEWNSRPMSERIVFGAVIVGGIASTIKLAMDAFGSAKDAYNKYNSDDVPVAASAWDDDSTN